MKRSEIIRAVSIQTGISIRACSLIYDAIFEEMIEAIINGEKIHVDGFFTMETFMQKGRNVKDFKTGETIFCQPSRRVRCKISKKLKDAVKRK